MLLQIAYKHKTTQNNHTNIVVMEKKSVCVYIKLISELILRSRVTLAIGTG